MYTWHARTHILAAAAALSGLRAGGIRDGLLSHRGDPDAGRRCLLLWRARRGVKLSMAAAGDVESAEFVFSCTSWAVKWVSKHMAKKSLSHRGCSTAFTTSAYAAKINVLLSSWWSNTLKRMPGHQKYHIDIHLAQDRFRQGSETYKSKYETTRIHMYTDGNMSMLVHSKTVYSGTPQMGSLSTSAVIVRWGNESSVWPEYLYLHYATSLHRPPPRNYGDLTSNNTV